MGYAYEGLAQWATKMVPTLFPFMIISSLMIHTGADIHFTRILSPMLKPLFACSTNGLYAIFMGFLCGFPMGAKATCDLLKCGKISKPEAEYLLAFCNNIGPTYFASIIIPLLQGCGFHQPLPFLFGTYGIPFLYGILLGNYRQKSIVTANQTTPTGRNNPKKIPVTQALRLSCQSSIQSILLLGGYVTFVNAFRIIPELAALPPEMQAIAGGFLEIIQGIPGICRHALLSNRAKAFWTVLAVSFSGISCMLQTSSITGEADLSMKKYIFHKCIITGITAVYYFIYISITASRK